MMNLFQYKGKGGLTSLMRKRLTSAARCAIKMRSKEKDQKKAVKLLEQDLINGPRHCFGIHSHCSSDFCKHKQPCKGPTQDDHQTCDEDSGDTIAGAIHVQLLGYVKLIQSICYNTYRYCSRSSHGVARNHCRG